MADWLNDLRGQISDVKLNSGAVFMTFIGRQLERYYDEEYSFLLKNRELAYSSKNKVKLMSAIDNGYEVEKEPTIHELKILPEYFEAVVSGISVLKYVRMTETMKRRYLTLKRISRRTIYR